MIGSDSLLARNTGVVIKDQLRALQAELVGEIYLNGAAELGVEARNRGRAGMT